MRLKEGPDSGRAPAFARIKLRLGENERFFTGDSTMNGKKILGILAGLMLVFVLAWPLAAAEKSFDLTIPGCTA